MTDRTTNISTRLTSMLCVSFICGSTMLAHGDQALSTDPEPTQTQTHSSTEESEPSRKALQVKINPEALRDRLSRSIRNAELLIERHSKAIEKLDAGESPNQVLQDLRLRGVARRIKGENDSATTPKGAPIMGSEHGQTQRNTHDDGPMHPENSAITPAKFKLFMEQNFAQLWSSFQQIRLLDPKSADRLMERIQPQIHEIMILSTTEPDLGKIKLMEMRSGLDFVEAARVYRQLINSGDFELEELAAADKNMRRLAQQRVEAQIDAKRFEVQRLEARLNELKATIEDVELHKDDEIQQMIQHAQKPKKRSNKHTHRKP